MANEIKFIFTGDTAAFDKAIDSVVKKTNKAKSSTEGITEAQKVQAKLQRLLTEEYKKAAKVGGSVAEIEKKIKKTEEERLVLAKELNLASKEREQRLKAILEIRKKEAQIEGFKTARTGVKAATVTGATSYLGWKGAGVGLKAAKAGGKIVGATAAVGAFAASGVMLPVAAILLSILAVMAAVVAVTAAVKLAIEGTPVAIAQAMGIQNVAQLSGKTIAQVQTEVLAGQFGGDPKKVGTLQLFRDLGLIIDEEIIKSLSDSGNKIKVVGVIIWNRLIPAFEALARAAGSTAGWLAKKGSGVSAGMGPVSAHRKAMPWWTKGSGLLNLIGAGAAWWQYDSTSAGVAEVQQEKRLKQMLDQKKELEAAELEASVSPAKMKALTSTDFLTRIGIFKGGSDSQLQTSKANLAAVQAIQGNTNGMIPAITNA
jgi:hypothetical protein